MNTVEWAYPLICTVGESEALAKHLNRIHLAPTAPVVQKPLRASTSLLYQAQKMINKRPRDRKKIIGMLATSTARKVATVVPAPAVSPAPAPPQPGANAPAAAGSGNGGGGYSGNAATHLGAPSVAGTTTATTPLPKP